MTFAETLSAACATVAAAMGETVTHTAADDTETGIDDATFSEAAADIADVRDGLATVRRATCTIAAADVAAPARGDTITRGAETWTVEHKPLAVGGGDYWELALKAAAPIEKTRQGHRLAR